MVYNGSLRSLEQSSTNPKPMAVMKLFIPHLKAENLCFRCSFMQFLQFWLISEKNQVGHVSVSTLHFSYEAQFSKICSTYSMC